MHDISWGTKGENKAAGPVIVTKQTEDGKKTALFETPHELGDKEDQWEEFKEKLAEASETFMDRSTVAPPNWKTKQEGTSVL